MEQLTPLELPDDVKPDPEKLRRYFTHVEEPQKIERHVKFWLIAFVPLCLYLEWRWAINPAWDDRYAILNHYLPNRPMGVTPVSTLCWVVVKDLFSNPLAYLLPILAFISACGLFPSKSKIKLYTCKHKYQKDGKLLWGLFGDKAFSLFADFEEGCIVISQTKIREELGHYISQKERDTTFSMREFRYDHNEGHWIDEHVKVVPIVHGGIAHDYVTGRSSHVWVNAGNRCVTEKTDRFETTDSFSGYSLDFIVHGPDRKKHSVKQEHQSVEVFDVSPAFESFWMPVKYSIEKWNMDQNDRKNIERDSARQEQKR